MRLTFSSPDLSKPGALAVFATEKATLSPSAEKLDRQTGGQRSAMAASITALPSQNQRPQQSL